MESHKITNIQAPSAAPPKLTGYNLQVGQYGLTPLGDYVIRSENSLVFLADGSSSSGNLYYTMKEIFPVGTKITIEVQR